MKALISFSLLMTLGFACNGTDLKSTQNKSGASSADGSNGEGGAVIDPSPTLGTPSPIDPSTPIAPVEGAPESVVLTPAIVPTVIAGANLTCSATALGAECETTLKESLTPSDIPGVKFYIIKPVDLVWNEIQAQRIQAGRYAIATNLESYAIGMSLADSSATGTWVKPPPQNLVKNGTFEDYAPGLYPTVDTDSWRAALPPAKEPCEANYIEIVVAGDGKKFMDLNAACTVGVRDYSSAMVYQGFATKAGNLYQTFFEYSGNLSSGFVAPSGISVYWNSLAMFNATLPAETSLNWKEKSFVNIGTSATGVLQFHDSSGLVHGRGSLVDNVRVFDLGAGPR